MKWSADLAIRAARAFQPYDLTWLEEPVIPDDVAGHARVVAEGGVPIASGENLRTLWDFKQLIAAGGVTYPEPDVTNCGGVTAFMKIARLAEAFNLPVTSHGAHDVTVQLLAACPNRSYLEAHGFGLDRYMCEPLRHRGRLRHRSRSAGPRHRVRLAGARRDPRMSARFDYIVVGGGAAGCVAAARLVSPTPGCFFWRPVLRIDIRCWICRRASSR